MIICESWLSANPVYMCFVYGKGLCHRSPRHLVGGAVGVFPWVYCSSTLINSVEMNGGGDLSET